MATDEVYYRWVDKDGIVQFSSAQPKTIDAEKVAPARHFGYPLPLEPAKKPDDLSDNSPTAQRQEIPPDLPLTADDAELQRATAITALKRTNCRKGQSNLRQLSAYQRISIKTPEGKIRNLSQSEKEAAINRANNLIHANC